LETYLMNKTQEAFGSSENITKYYLKCSGESPFSNLTIFTKEKLLEAETALNLSLQLGEPKVMEMVCYLIKKKQYRFDRT